MSNQSAFVSQTKLSKLAEWIIAKVCADSYGLSVYIKTSKHEKGSQHARFSQEKFGKTLSQGNVKTSRPNHMGNQLF